MSKCGCNSPTSNKNNTTQDTDNLVWNDGSFAGGAKLTFTNTERSLNLFGVRAPNVLIFTENPCLLPGDDVIVDNVKLLTCTRDFASCLVIATTPVKVGEKYEVETNGNWKSLTDSPTLTFEASSTSVFCPTPDAIPSVKVSVCNKGFLASDFIGEVYNRSTKSAPMSGGVYVFNGTNEITAKGNYRPRQGDTIEIKQTALVGSNAAKVLYVSASNNQPTIIKLDRILTGVTATAANGAIPCVDATSRPSVVATLRFEASCGCKVSAILDPSYTNDPNFPQGISISDSSNCYKYGYCFTIVNRNPNAIISSYKGQLILQ